jgi:hypothetical protein
MYVIATTDNVLRFYVFRAPEVAPKLLDRLDVHAVSWFNSKDEAKRAALSAGLRTWRYVRLV